MGNKTIYHIMEKKNAETLCMCLRFKVCLKAHAHMDGDFTSENDENVNAARYV